VRRLADRLLKVAGVGQYRPLVSRRDLVRAIVETIVALPVYRTYVDGRSAVPGAEDRNLLEGAIAEARTRGRSSGAALDLLAEALLARGDTPRGPEVERFRLRFVERFQQLSGPATAKGVEDTAFYAYAPLLSRNEVGGGPEAPLARAAADFHAGNARRAARWSGGLLAVTTHDTKRTADVRSRLDVLSEIPAEWADRLGLWRRLNLPHKQTVRGRRRVPDPTTVLHMLQAMVAVWPVTPPDLDELEVLRERIGGYMEKAVREAKLRTTWTDPDETFEAALRSNVGALLAPDRSPDFLNDLHRFVTQIARAGYWNALGRTVLHLGSPGIPDLYQGDELWNLGLVDPDNRRPVDFEVRRRLLKEVERGTAGGPEARARYLADLVDNPDDGRLKLHVIRAALAARNQRPPAFRSSTYVPLEAVGRSVGRVIAFGRGEGTERLLVVVPRFLARHVLSGGGPTDSALWEGTALPLPAGWPSQWICALSGRTHRCEPARGLRAADLFGILPVALLLSHYDT
jgi:(1->4)-alpha-D-glucan 1-alpha-D-glucosylmutase